MRLLTFLAGAAAGYVLGTRSGRESYEQMKAKVLELWEDPRTQEKLGKLGDTVTSAAPGSQAADREPSGTPPASGSGPAHRAEEGDGVDSSNTSATRRPSDDDD